MSARIVARAIYQEIADENLELFRNRYLETEYQSVPNHSFRRAMEFAQRLSKDDQHILMEIVRQVSVDTASTVLGVFEGSVLLDGIDGELTIIYDDKQISDEIQTMFLIAEEEHQESTKT